MFPASKSAAYDLAPELMGSGAKRFLEHFNAILCDFVHDLVHFENWLSEQKKNIKYKKI